MADATLVAPNAQSVPLKLVREGVRYDELTTEEHEHWESLEWPVDEETGEFVIPEEVDGGDKLGKTSIFVRNNAHAKFIAERFDHHYPHYNGQHAAQFPYRRERGAVPA